MARTSPILDQSGRPYVRASYAGGYEGGTSGRRLGTWGTSTSGQNALAFANLTTLRSRSREMVRNNPDASGALDTLVANLAGVGIFPRWNHEDADRKKELRQWWDDWGEYADYDGLTDIYGLFALAVRSMVEGGGCIIRMHYRAPSPDMPIPLQLQLLEGDHLDHTYSTINAKNGNEIRMGIEINRWAKPVAYWLFREHPGESYFSTRTYPDERVRVPARDIVHLFRPLRPGQRQGIPWPSSNILTQHDVNEFDDAEIMRKKGAAMFGGYLTRPPQDEDTPAPFGETVTDDPEGRDNIVALEPGTFPELPPGWGVEWSSPADVGGGYAAFTKRQDRRLSRGWGCLPYEKYTGDLEGVTYSSIRSGNLEFQRICRQIIRHTIIPQMCRPIGRKFVAQAILSKAVEIPDFMEHRLKYYRITWNHTGWEWVDPDSELKAAKGKIRSGLSTRTKTVDESSGEDVTLIDEQNAADNARADELGLVYDTDPRHTDAAGKRVEEKEDGGKTE